MPQIQNACHADNNLLCFLRLFCLQSLFPVASDHDDGEEGADDGGTEENEDDGNADGPDSRWEEAVEWVLFVDEWLWLD